MHYPQIRLPEWHDRGAPRNYSKCAVVFQQLLQPASCNRLSVRKPRAPPDEQHEQDPGQPRGVSASLRNACDSAGFVRATAAFEHENDWRAEMIAGTTIRWRTIINAHLPFDCCRSR